MLPGGSARVPRTCLAICRLSVLESHTTWCRTATLGKLKKQTLSCVSSNQAEMNCQHLREMRTVLLLISCTLLWACGPQNLRIGNLDWDIQPDPIFRETTVRHSRPKDPQERYDPQEYDPALQSVFAEADAITERLVGNVARDEYFGSTFWATKKRLLSQEYDIDWRSPAEINPSIEYGSYGQRKLSDTEKSNIRAVVRHYLESESAEASLIQRRFEGEVRAYAAKGDETFQLIISGHQYTWEVLSFGLVQF